jgi:hypothetical protein
MPRQTWVMMVVSAGRSAMAVIDHARVDFLQARIVAALCR